MGVFPWVTFSAVPLYLMPAGFHACLQSRQGGFRWSCVGKWQFIYIYIYINTCLCNYVWVHINISLGLCLSVSFAKCVCISASEGVSGVNRIVFSTLSVDLFLHMMDAQTHTHSNTFHHHWSTQNNLEATHHCLRVWISQSHVHHLDVKLHHCDSVPSHCTSPGTSVVCKSR